MSKNEKKIEEMSRQVVNMTFVAYELVASSILTVAVMDALNFDLDATLQSMKDLPNRDAAMDHIYKALGEKAERILDKAEDVARSKRDKNTWLPQGEVFDSILILTWENIRSNHSRFLQNMQSGGRQNNE